MDKKTTTVIKKSPRKKLAISNYISLFDARSTKKAKQSTVSKTSYESKVQPKAVKKSGHGRETHSTLTLPPEVDDSAAIAYSPVPKTKASKFSKLDGAITKQYAGEWTKPSSPPEVIQSSERVATQYEHKVLAQCKLGASVSGKPSTFVKDDDNSTLVGSHKYNVKDKGARESSQIVRNYKEMVRAVVASQYHPTSVMPRVIIILISWFVIFAGVMLYAFFGTNFMVPLLHGFNILDMDDGFCFVEVKLVTPSEKCQCF